MLPSINFGSITLYFYPFFWGLAWATSFIFVHHQLDQSIKFRNYFYILAIFFVSSFGAKILFLASSIDSFFASSQLVSFSSGVGFVFYGGLILGAILVALISFFDRNWAVSAVPLMVKALPLGHAIGRLGCLFAGCCFGISWIFPCCIVNNELIYRIPIPLIEAFFLLLIFWKLQKSNNVLSQYLILYGTLRLCLEILRDDIRGMWWIFPPSVWISLIFIYLGIFFSHDRFKQRRI